MIALSLRRRGVADQQNAEIGMLDVSANALAVLILATMLVIATAAPPLPRGEVRTDAAPPLFYPPPIDNAISPQNRYVLVLPEGLVPLDLNAFAQALSFGETTASTTQGTITLVTDRRMYRDLNDYRASIDPDYVALAADAMPLSPQQLASEVAKANQDFGRNGVATSYFVSVAAMENFAPLYWALREAQVPMRWLTVPKEQKLVFTRRAENYEGRARQWQ